MDKSKVMNVGENLDPSLLDSILNREKIEVGTTFKYLRSYFSSDGGVKEDVSMRVGRV